MTKVDVSLPQGWALATLGDITNRTGQRVPAEDFIYVDISSVDGERGTIQTPKKLAPDGAPSRARKEIRASDTIFATTRPYLKNIAFVPSWLDDQICSTGFCVLRPLKPYVDSKFLFHLSRTDSVLSQVNKFMRGVSYPAVSDKDILSATIFLPPLNEQKRIVEKLEQLLSELDKAVDALKAAQQKLKTYRRAVLKAAVEGELSRVWREENKERLEPADKLLRRIENRRNAWLENPTGGGKDESKRLQNNLKLHTFETPSAAALPENWAWASLLTACWLVVDCHNKTAPYEDDGIMLVRTTNIRNGSLNLQGVKYVSENTYQYWSRRCPPESGDVLFTREAPVGEAAVIPSGTKLCMGQRMMLLRVFEDLLDNQYLLYSILEPGFRDRYSRNKLGTGVQHLRVGDVESLVIPVPPCEEQLIIAEEAEKHMSLIDATEKGIQDEILKATKLRQAILQKAFSGRLVPQDPNDEPASALLERIRAEREAAGAKGKRGKKKMADEVQPRLLEVDA